ncbi:outer membrane receptor protein involved in Fe transport [Sphingobium sp. B1D7B]|uniref:TonB-dependent receptor plug domain-containing protein n=1 Tax=Sphingobium sp. B1D7B TaxID=2940578 RepID=UPI0022240171|nr:TonB-dependent receptor plug domain-containing protein [Sphingobium sp. B1D7B]MCW2405187.1 outer membrane receptor protein involved in Fe transport [Sphingobium sp. B1D7B]
MTLKVKGRGGASHLMWAALPAAALLSMPVQAQDGGGAENASEPSIVVTGTRIRNNAFNEPTPATVFGIEQTEKLGIVNAGDIVELIPQNTAFQSDATAGITAGANVGASYANLRGLNPDSGTRTLTLVNSRRFVPTSDGGAVDLNLIPTAMIKRVETVTGGASAAYGSDAIAGVVNLILDTELEGLRGQVDYGQTFRGDGKGHHGSLVYGTRVGSRGHIVIGGEYEKKDGIGDCSLSRDWCAESYDVFVNANNVLANGSLSGFDRPGTPGYGLPNFIIGPNSKQAFNDARGVVRNRAPAAPAARNIRFNDDGTGIVQFDPGTYVQSSQTGPRQGGDGESTYADSDIQTPVERFVGYLSGKYDLSDTVEAYTEVTYAHRSASNSGVTAGPRSTYFVKPDNAFLPASLKTLLAGTQFSLGKDVDAQIPALNSVTADVWRAVFGVTGEIGGGWNWDVYYQYGRNKRHQSARYSRVNTEFQYGLDAVVNPANNQIVCRELLKANPDPRAQGCVPMNLFGLDNLSQAAIDYAYRPVVEDFLYTQHVAAASISGSLFDGFGAGPVGAATGVEYRKEKGDVTHGDIPNYTDYAFTFGLDYGGTIEVLETFGEVSVPLLANRPFFETLELNGAVRWTRNKASDAFTSEEKTTEAVSYKLSGIWEIGGGVRLRGSRSRDIRAAGFRELFQRQVATEEGSSQGIVDNPNITGVGNDDPTPILNGGSFALTPEKADTTTAGIVFRPGFIPGLRMSVDWYQIAIEDAVSRLGGQQIVDFCDQFDIFCDRITFVSPTNISYIDARQVNLGNMTVRGLDFEFDYTLRLSDLSADWGGALNLRVLANHQYDFKVQADPTTPVIDYAGQTGPVSSGGNFNPAPSWIVNAFLSYDSGPFNATVSMRRISSGIYNVERVGPEDEGYDPTLRNSINTNRVKGASYFGLAMSYAIPVGNGGNSIEVFGAIDNIFDKKPPIAPGGGGLGGSNYPTNPVYFDTFGARFRTGVRVKF